MRPTKGLLLGGTIASSRNLLGIGTARITIFFHSKQFTLSEALPCDTRDFRDGHPAGAGIQQALLEGYLPSAPDVPGIF